MYKIKFRVVSLILSMIFVLSSVTVFASPNREDVNRETEQTTSAVHEEGIINSLVRAFRGSKAVLTYYWNGYFVDRNTAEAYSEATDIIDRIEVTITIWSGSTEFYNEDKNTNGEWAFAEVESGAYRAPSTLP